VKKITTIGYRELAKMKWRKPDAKHLQEEHKVEGGFFSSWPEDNGVEKPTAETFTAGALAHGRVETIPHADIPKRVSEHRSSSEDKYVAEHMGKLKAAVAGGAELPMPIVFQTQRPDSNYHKQYMVFSGRHRLGLAHEGGHDAQVLVLPYPEHGQELYSPKTKLKKSELEKGKKGDWKNEGYRLEHEVHPASTPHSYEEHYISAYSPAGERVGFVNITASAPIDAERGHERYGTAHGTKVHPDHRRKGIANAMYSLFEQKTGMKLRPDEDQSEDAKTLWSQPNRPFGKKPMKKSERARIAKFYLTRAKAHLEAKTKK
jgi:ribosomal protein S18 acetylase RimI-like enzyme